MLNQSNIYLSFYTFFISVWPLNHIYFGFESWSHIPAHTPLIFSVDISFSSFLWPWLSFTGLAPSSATVFVDSLFFQSSTSCSVVSLGFVSSATSFCRLRLPVSFHEPLCQAAEHVVKESQTSFVQLLFTTSCIGFSFGSKEIRNSFVIRSESNWIVEKYWRTTESEIVLLCKLCD